MDRDIPLSSLKPGVKAVVAALKGDEKQVRKLLVFGILPGAVIEVVQVFPGYILAIGNTLLALDREIAENIAVKKEI